MAPEHEAPPPVEPLRPGDDLGPGRRPPGGPGGHRVAGRGPRRRHLPGPHGDARLRHGAGWDDELEGMAAGMRAALHALASYRTHFPGRPAAWVRVSGAGTGAAAAAWDELTGALGLAGAGPGRRVPGGPRGARPARGGER